MIDKVITFCGQPARVACDEKCDKAFGISRRPSIRKRPSEPEMYFADDEVGTAPVDPGTYEGNDGKPRTPEERPNKWCVRACERMSISNHGESERPITLRDFSKRVPT